MGNQKIFHKTIYDLKSLSKILTIVNFNNIKKYNWRETCHSDFDDHSQAYWPHMDKTKGTLISLNVECVK